MHNEPWYPFSPDGNAQPMERFHPSPDVPSVKQLEQRMLAVLTLLGRMSGIGEAGFIQAVNSLSADVWGYYGGFRMLSRAAADRIDAHGRKQLPFLSAHSVPYVGLRFGDKVLISDLSARADLNGLTGEVIGRFDTTTERFPICVGTENVRVRSKNLQAVDAAYTAPLTSQHLTPSRSVDDNSYGYAAKDVRRKPSTNPLAAELSQALGAKTVSEVEAVATIGPQGAARILEILEGGRAKRRSRRSTAEDEQAARDGQAQIDHEFTAAMQLSNDAHDVAMNKDWPLGEGDDGPWRESSGLPRGYVKRDGLLTYVGGIPRKLAKEWSVGAGELGYEGEPHTAETKEERDAALARIMASMR